MIQDLKAFDPTWLGEYIFLHEVDSTNTYLLQAVKDKKVPEKSIVIANLQTHGKGRLGRTWVSPAGANLYLSFYWHFPFLNSKLSALSLVVGLSVVQALSLIGITGLGLKWPNDVLFESKKLAGILIESCPDKIGGVHAIIGIGVNLKLEPEIRASINQAVTDLFEISGHCYTVEEIALTLIKKLLINLAIFEKTGFQSFQSIWQQYDVLYKQAIVIHKNALETEEAKAWGVNEMGALLVEQQGIIYPLYSHEVSIRKQS